MFQGNSINVQRIEEGFVELCFDRREDSINKFDQRTRHELADAVGSIAGDGTVRGVLITSAKKTFVVGADINELSRRSAFRRPTWPCETSNSIRALSTLRTYLSLA